MRPRQPNRKQVKTNYEAWSLINLILKNVIEIEKSIKK